MNQGVIILALKKDSYACAAFNLALSIKYHNPSINITLISDGQHLNCYQVQHFAVFDNIKEMNICDYTGENGFCPAKAKLNAYKYSLYERTLFIDADSLCIQDPQLLFDKLKGGAYKTNNIDGYTQWCEEDVYKEFFGMPFGLTVNSSWQYFEDNKIYIQANEFYNKGFKIENIKPKWGSTLCDEIFVNASINKLQIDPKVPFDVMFFGNNIDPRTLDKIEQDYYFFTLYGNRTTVRKVYIDWYDRLMFKMAQKFGLEHRFKASQILVGKHVSNKIDR